MFISRLIRSYQKYFSPLTHSLLSPLTGSTHSCRFTPTCSEYTLQAIDKYGSIKGLYLGIKRFLRCHPFSQGGFDPVK